MRFCTDTGIPSKQDYSKLQSWIMWLGFKGYGQSPEDGAKPLVYACCAPEEDLRGRCAVYQVQDSNTGFGNKAAVIASVYAAVLFMYGVLILDTLLKMNSLACI